MNKVIGGDYVGYNVECTMGHVYLKKIGSKIELNRADVASMELVDGTQRTSATRMMAKSFLFSPFGQKASIFGGLTAKSKRTLYVAVTLNNGRNMMIEADEKLYRKMIKYLY